MAKDFSIVPSVITITNIDPGVIDKELTTVVDKVSGETTTQEVEVVYLTEPMEQKVQLFKLNFWVTLAVGEELKIAAQTAEEVAYYSAMANDRLSVEVEAAEDGNEG